MIRRFGAALLGFSAVGSFALAGGSGPAGVWPEFTPNAACEPAIQSGSLRLGTQPDAAASAQMQTIFAADQVDRQGDIDWEAVGTRDLEREKQVLKLLENGRLFTGKDLLAAAYVFHHGSCPNHYLLAHTLAKQAIVVRGARPKWMYASTLDRWLLSTGQPQKYGTQPAVINTVFDFYTGRAQACERTEAPIDPAVTDAERARYDVQPLTELQALYAQSDEADLRNCQQLVEQGQTDK